MIFVGALALAGSLSLPAIAGQVTGFELGVSLLNFGALIAFMGVNAAAFFRFFVRGKKTALSFFPPLLGFFVCLLPWWNLTTRARILGALWMLVGLGVGTCKTRGFRGDWMKSELPAADRQTDE